MRDTYGDSLKQIIELISGGKEELIKVFEDWGFELDTNGVPKWESKNDYYKYSMIKSV